PGTSLAPFRFALGSVLLSAPRAAPAPPRRDILSAAGDDLKTVLGRSGHVILRGGRESSRRVSSSAAAGLHGVQGVRMSLRGVLDASQALPGVRVRPRACARAFPRLLTRPKRSEVSQRLVGEAGAAGLRRFVRQALRLRLFGEGGWE